jgi:hypothetical protein
MRLGVAYNVFDGIELLESSIDSVRPVADYICVIYQTTSNLGNFINADVEAEVRRLRMSGKIDEMARYVPKVNGGHVNELAKRNWGLDLAKSVGCTHFMTMDVDELYDKDELMFARQMVEAGGFQSSACKMLTYYRSGEFIVDPPEEYYVPLIYKIDGRVFSMSSRWPVAADPTRRMLPGNIKLFERNEIQMHHFSYVRKDIRAKLINSSASVNFKDRIEEIAQHYENWQYGQKCLFAGKERRMYDVKRVDNKFNIQDQCA